MEYFHIPFSVKLKVKIKFMIPNNAKKTLLMIFGTQYAVSKKCFWLMFNSINLKQNILYLCFCSCSFIFLLSLNVVLFFLTMA